MVLLDLPSLDPAETSIIAEILETHRRLLTILNRSADWHRQLMDLAQARNIRASTGIEGHQVSLDDAVSALNGESPRQSSRTGWENVRKYGQAMSYVGELANDPDFEYEVSLIRSLHFMMTRHAGKEGPGVYRPGGVSVRGGEPQPLVFEDVPGAVGDLIGRLRSDVGDPLSRAAMAHLNLAVIRPFREANGLIGRAVQTLVLAREGVLPLPLASIEEYVGANRDEYFATMAEVGAKADARPWVRFVLRAHYDQALTWVDRVHNTEKLWNAIDAERRRLGVGWRGMPSLFQAASQLQVRRSDHIRHTGVGDRVASSDLKSLVDTGLLVAVGDRRGRYYVGSHRLTTLAKESTEPPTPIPDAFTGRIKA